MTDQPSVLTSSEVAGALQRLPEWRSRLGGLHTVYQAPTSEAAIELVYRIGQLANQLNHHPDLDWRYDHVFIRTRTHSAGGKVTAKDVELAEGISRLADGAVAHPELYRDVEIGVDTAHADVIRPVWQEVLGYRTRDGQDLADPWGRGPTVWFQPTETPDASRLHLDVWVENDDADAVLAGAETAGAQRLDDAYRPSFTVIGDEDGNRFCVCTTLGRDA